MNFIRRYWKQIAVLVALVGAFAVGRYTTPGPDVVVAQSIRFVERVVEVQAKAKTKTVVVYRDRTVKPDGTVVEHEEEHATTDTKTAKTTTRDGDLATDTKSSSTSYKPQWRVGALLGFNFGGVRLQPLSVGSDAFAWGAFAERRIAGPFFIGVYGLSVGPTFGLTLGVEF